MGLVLEVTPVTDHDPRELAYDAHEVVTHNAPVLAKDFIELPERYRTYGLAARALRNAQQRMRRERGTQVLVVRAGYQADTPDGETLETRFIGMATSRFSRVPDNDEPGMHFSMWLDSRRPALLRRIGPALMERRMAYTYHNPHAIGRVWTIIRPSNRPSVKTWVHPYNWGGFEARGTPRRYTEKIDDRWRRQLYVARVTLEDLRRGYE